MESLWNRGTKANGNGIAWQVEWSGGGVCLPAAASAEESFDLQVIVYREMANSTLSKVYFSITDLLYFYLFASTIGGRGTLRVLRCAQAFWAGSLYGSTYCFLAWPCSVRVVLLLYFFQFNNKIRDVKLKVSQRSSGCRWKQNRTEEVEYKFTRFSVLWRSPGSSGLMMVAVRYVLLLKLNQAECDEKKLVILALELNGFSSSSDIL